MSGNINTVPHEIFIVIDMFWYYVSGQSGSEQIEVANWRPGTADCRNEHHMARLASRRAGDGAHRDIERERRGPDRICDMMVPSTARVACIVRAACTSLDQNRNKKNFLEQSDTMGRVKRYILI